jgi:capsular polysaccharide biosynthesis protein
MLRKGMVWIILITLLCSILGGIYAYFFKETKYVAKLNAQVFTRTYEDSVGNEEELPEHTAFQYCAMLVPQVRVVFTSNEVMNKVESSGIDLKGSINFVTTTDSPYFSVTYTYKQHGGNVEQIKEEVAQTLNAYVNKCIDIVDMDKKHYTYLCEKIIVYSEAISRDVSVSTGRVLTVLIAFAIGLILSIALVIVTNMLDDRIYSKEQVEAITDGQCIAVIDITSKANDYREIKSNSKGDK